MEIFIDTAITEEIEKASKLGVIKGVTTNPSLLKKSGKTLKEVILEILKLVKGPVSAEVKESTAENMYYEAKEIVEMVGNNEYITIKLPMTEEGIKVCKKLKKHNIHIYNATRGGNLEVFPRVKLEDVLSKKREESK